MIDVKTFNTHLSNTSTGIMNGVTLDQVLIFRREGIAMQFEAATYGTVSQVCEVWQFRQSLFRNDPVPPVGQYWIKTYNGMSGMQRKTIFEIGPDVQIGRTYNITTNIGPVYSFTVTSAFETFTEVLTSLEVQLLTDGFTTSILGNTIEILGPFVVTLTESITWSGFDLERYISGIFIKIDGEEFILVYAESPTAYPDYPSFAGPYDYNDLTVTGYSGVSNYSWGGVWNSSGYTESEVGTATIDNIPDVGAGGPDPSKVYIDDLTDTFILGTPTTDLVERFDVIYKVVY